MTQFCRDDSDCSRRGQCIDGRSCRCDQGYAGDRCQCKLLWLLMKFNNIIHFFSATISQFCQSRADCNNRGTCVERQRCQCDGGFSGDRCQVSGSACSSDSQCNNGRCINNACVCSPGYIGQFCDRQGWLHLLLITK